MHADYEVIRLTDEGIRDLPEDVPRIIRVQKVDDMLKFIDDNKTILVRPAPATGKTSLLQQLQDRLKQQGRKVGVLHLHRAYLRKPGEKEPKDAEEFDVFFEKAVGIRWTDLLSFTPTPPPAMQLDHAQSDNTQHSDAVPPKSADYVLLVDETQKIYTDYAQHF